MRPCEVVEMIKVPGPVGGAGAGAVHWVHANDGQREAAEALRRGPGGAVPGLPVPAHVVSGLHGPLVRQPPGPGTPRDVAGQPLLLPHLQVSPAATPSAALGLFDLRHSPLEKIGHRSISGVDLPEKNQVLTFSSGSLWVTRGDLVGIKSKKLAVDRLCVFVSSKF